MKFCNRLYELRKKNGLSQEELAYRLNVTRQTISKWELGESTPDMEKLTMLSDYFHISLDELVLGKVSEEPSEERAGKTTAAKLLEQKIFTDENRANAKRILKILGMILAALLVIDVISFMIYFLFCGFPQ